MKGLCCAIALALSAVTVSGCVPYSVFDRHSQSYVGAAVGSEGLPQLDLPLPTPSTRRNLSPAVFGSPAVLGGVERRLRSRLLAKGYDDIDYYAVPGGFAMVADLERIDEQGRAYPPPERFSLLSTGLCRFELRRLLDCLTNADPGRYRMLVFLVTTAMQTTAGGPATFAEVQEWSEEGGDFLPSAIAERPLTSAHNISALVYEFRRPSVTASPVKVTGLGAIAHLRAAGILD